MSILIKGMEMPEDGKYKLVYIYSDGHVSVPFWEDYLLRASGIEAVPISAEEERLITGRNQ